MDMVLFDRVRRALGVERIEREPVATGGRTACP
jgi:hypothetical protein